jgi:hypothetical protein
VGRPKTPSSIDASSRGPGGRSIDDPLLAPGGFSLAVPLAATAGLGVAIYWFAGFVQDDAFISLRYAANLARGDGLVFNPGERVEGITNLLWTLLAALLMKLGIPALESLRLIGAASAFGLIWLVWREAGGERWPRSNGPAWCGGIAAAVLASHSSLALWAASGLEQVPFTLLLFAGYREFSRDRTARAAGWWLVATLTRPEGALAFGVAAVVRTSRLLAHARLPGPDERRAVMIYLTGFCLLVAFRLAYFGDALPNTYYVKGIANRYTHQHGLSELSGFLFHDGFGLVLALSVVGLMGTWAVPSGLDLHPSEAVAFSALFLGGFLYYLVRVGGDILPFYRLWIPVLPFGALWAGRAVWWLFGISLVHSGGRRGRSLRCGAGLATLGGLSLAAVAVYGGWTTASHPEFRSSLPALEACHGVLGDHLERLASSRPRNRPLTVIAQDMGLTPYRAPRARFIDTVGLTDRSVAHLLHRFDYNPYVRWLMWPDETLRRQIGEMEVKLRRYLESRRADCVVINASCEPSETGEVRAALARREPGPLARSVSQNMFYYGLADTPAFCATFRLARSFEFSAVHFLLLYERIDR